ncbi:MAG: DUF3310 domain-containing protein [Cytophagia bacterium]|nr:DUF3310 domain-containing protein [Cytophagia bacterium]
MKDNVNPSHYKQGKVECIDAIESATIHKQGLMAVCTGNIIKYVWRCEEKGGLEDLKKAKWYLDRLIASEESKIAIENFEQRNDTNLPNWSKL